MPKRKHTCIQNPGDTFSCKMCKCTFKRKKLNKLHFKNIHGTHICEYCQESFVKKNELQNHTYCKHSCKTCRKIVLTNIDIRKHEILHKAEERLKQIEKEKQKFLENEMLTNLKDEELWKNYKPFNDFTFCLQELFYYNDFDIDDILKLIEKFGDDVLEQMFLFDNMDVEILFKLVEMKYFDFDWLASILDCNSEYLAQTEEFVDILEYLIDHEYKVVNPEWIVKILSSIHFQYDDIMKKIMENFKFTFDEIFNLRCHMVNPVDSDQFYVKVHKYFPNPHFKDPFNLYSEFNTIKNNHVEDYLQNRYFHYKEEDTVSIVIFKNFKEFEIDLGNLNNLISKPLDELIEKHNRYVESVKILNNEISDEFKNYSQQIKECKTEKEKLSILDDQDFFLYRGKIPERNMLSNEIAKLFYAISKK